jgi:hypothetical protein
MGKIYGNFLTFADIFLKFTNAIGKSYNIESVSS